MILVLLGTQDKDFPRLLEAIDKAIDEGSIQDKVMVQAGQTKYTSSNMEIFDLLPAPEFEKLMNEADLIITHGGAGSIIGSLKRGKKVIAAARLSKYKEHHNDHQRQIVGELAKEGYILELRDFQKLGKVIEKSKTFKPRKFESNTLNMIHLLDQYIEETNHTAWFHKYHEIISYLFFGFCTTLLNVLVFYCMRLLGLSLYLSNGISWIVSVLFAFLVNKKYVFGSKKNPSRECISFISLRLISLIVDMGLMIFFTQVLSVQEILSKIIVNIFVIIVNYIISKFMIFKK